MRVLLVNDYRVDGEDGGAGGAGGAEVLINATARLLRERGHDARLFTAEDATARRTPWSYIDSHAARRALRARLGSFEPDVVHLHNYYHVLSPGVLQAIHDWRQMRRNSSPASPPPRVVMTAHDFHLACPNSGMNWFFGNRVFRADARRLGDAGYLLSRRWDRRSVAHSALKVLQHSWNYRFRNRHTLIDCVICPSRFMRRVIEGIGVPSAVLLNPAPPPTGLGQERGHGAEHELQLVFVGRVEPEKGLDRFLELWPSDFPGRLLVVGDGSALNRCHAISEMRALTDRVEFAGRLPHDEALRAVASSHVLALPSRCIESAGLVLLEALSCKTNLLVSRGGGAEEIVRDAGVGFLFDVESGRGLNEAMHRIRADHAAGRLNDFDVSAFLHARSELAYIDGLEAIYQTQGISHHSAAGGAPHRAPPSTDRDTPPPAASC
jgi:glycosyltransferase involved in cell wall biosynthesis